MSREKIRVQNVQRRLREQKFRKAGAVVYGNIGNLKDIYYVVTIGQMELGMNK